MTHQPEPAVKLHAMRDFRPLVTPMLGPYPSPLPLPLPTHRADKRSLFPWSGGKSPMRVGFTSRSKWT